MQDSSSDCSGMHKPIMTIGQHDENTQDSVPVSDKAHYDYRAIDRDVRAIPAFRELSRLCGETNGAPSAEQYDRMMVLADKVNAIVAEWPSEHPNPSHLSPAPINAPQANLTPLAGIQDDDC